MGTAALSLATLPPDLLSTITHLVYMGYAGAVNARLKVGDVIPATQMMTANASSIQGETGRDQKDHHLAILMNQKITNLLYRAAEQVVLESVIDPLIDAEQESQFKLNAIPAIISGHVGDGDPFYISQKKIQHALKHNPNFICLEKEGMAVAMISEQYEIPSGMIHIIVQADNDREQIDYAAFITDVADRYIAAITFKFIHLLSESTSVSL
jgi:nucleoside phosphorylase